jgi:hypothetical protein
LRRRVNEVTRHPREAERRDRHSTIPNLVASKASIIPRHGESGIADAFLQVVALL